MRTPALALLAALVGGVAALGIGRAAGWLGTTTTETVESHGPPPRVLTVTRPGAAFPAARIYAERSAGVVTIFAYLGGAGSQGSGFVVSRSGTILTNAHVITNAGETAGPVRPASTVYVQFGDGDRVAARIVGWDVFDDVGVLRVDPAAHPLSPLPLGRSADLAVGAPVASIGSPLGNADSLSTGVVSAVHRSIAALTEPSFQLTDAIQTDAPIAHGSSGGPLLDGAGRVIGITAQIRSDAGGPAGIGFAVPIDSARRSLHALLTTGRVTYAFAGLSAEDLTPSLARRLGVPVERGALVDAVTPGGPADRAGLRGGGRRESILGEDVVAGGDVITRVGGTPIVDADTLVRLVTNTGRPGQRLAVTYVRGGATRHTTLVLGSRPAG